MVVLFNGFDLVRELLGKIRIFVESSLHPQFDDCRVHHAVWITRDHARIPVLESAPLKTLE